MIQEYVSDLAKQMGIPLSTISVVKGRDVGCFSVHLLHLSVNDHLVSALVHQSELEELQSFSCCDRLEMKVRSTLLRLQMNADA